MAKNRHHEIASKNCGEKPPKSSEKSRLKTRQKMAKKSWRKAAEKLRKIAAKKRSYKIPNTPQNLPIDEGKAVEIVYSDFSKAFDTISHGILLENLAAHGLEKVQSEVKSWLDGRGSRVVLNGAGSSWQPVTSGAPQGSALCPSVFCLFLDDLDEANECILRMLTEKVERDIFDLLEGRKALQRDLGRLDHGPRPVV
ncbi:hypothetical protein TURU_019420 [Turdus rufiventris]|nr:hypothetical protein TURU_019420 [Turdus rufiventris]